MRNYTVLDTIFLTTASETFIIVAINYRIPKYWQAYIAVCKYSDPNMDESNAEANGAKLSWKQAQGFFPQLDITSYKTYPKRGT